MWVKLFLKRTIYRLAVIFKDKQDELYMSGLLSILDEKDLKSLDDNDKNLVYMLLIYPSILTYTKHLTYCNSMLSDGVALANDWCRYDYMDSNLSSFLKDDKGNYIDTEKTVKEFKSRVSIFLKLYTEQLSSEDFTRKHNARVLTEFRRHLLDVIETLIRSTI